MENKKSKAKKTIEQPEQPEAQNTWGGAREGAGAEYKFSEQEMIDAIVKSAGYVSGAAKILKCSVQTVYNYIEKFESVRSAKFDIEERTLDSAEISLINNIQKGETVSIIFYLKTKGKNRGYVERQEQIISPGSSGEIVVFKLPDNGRK